MEWNEFLLDPRHVGEPLVVLKMIFEPMVQSAQTMHLSCVEINTISKQTETSFHFTHITKEFYWVRPKWFPCPWYIRCKPYTYLVSRLTLSRIGPEWVCTWPMSHRSTICCAQNNFRAYGMFGANRALILRRDCTIPKQTKMSFHLTYVT
jgi:hypothetical protein